MEKLNQKTDENRIIRIGTRKSLLAMAQTQLVADALMAEDPGLRTEIVPFVTKGDRILDQSLVAFGGKGVFVSEIEQAIADGRIDIAVHSAKDLPAEICKDLTICSVLKREDPRDVLVMRKETERGQFTKEHPMIIGTSSQRRKVQIEAMIPSVCHLLRGNVNTRLLKLKNGEYDGILLAAAGLKRLDLMEDPEFTYQELPRWEFVPSGGQGIIAVECRKDSVFSDLFRKIDDRETRLMFQAERAFLAAAGAGCHEAVGVYSEISDGEMKIRAMKEIDGRLCYAECSGKSTDGVRMAQDLYGELIGGKQS